MTLNETLTLAVQAGIVGACVYVATDLLCTYHRETRTARDLHRMTAAMRWSFWRVGLDSALPGSVSNPCDPSPR